MSTLQDSLVPMADRRGRHRSGLTMLRSPYPYFGGKRKVAETIWSRLGDAHNYVEPFFGSGAVLLGRPWSALWTGSEPPGDETVNDACGFVANFWRAMQSDPEALAAGVDWPVNECDLEARHRWLVGQSAGLDEALKRDPDFYDIKIAAWWCWGLCQWIGGGWCADCEPSQQIPYMDSGGRGFTRVFFGGSEVDLPHVGPRMPATQDMGVHRRTIEMIQHSAGRQVPSIPMRRAPRVTTTRRSRMVGDKETRGGSEGGHPCSAWFTELAARTRRVKVVCGDWSRVVSPAITFQKGLTAAFLDPPYADVTGRDMDVYRHDSGDVAHAVRAWAIEAGTRRDMRICLAGYEGEHAMPEDWECVEWAAQGGYSNQRKDGENHNRFRERLWFSPACIKPEKSRGLFDGASE